MYDGWYTKHLSRIDVQILEWVSIHKATTQLSLWIGPTWFGANLPVCQRTTIGLSSTASITPDVGCILTHACTSRMVRLGGYLLTLLAFSAMATMQRV